MTLRVVTPPTFKLLELQAAKLHLRVDHPDEDPLITDLIGMATQQVEAHTQRRYCTQTLEWVLPCWRPALRLPVAPVQDVIEIRYVDAYGGAQVLPTAAYVVSPDGATASIRPAFGTSWPVLGRDAAEAVVVKFVAGYAAADIPKAAVQAAKLWIAALFDNREGATPAGVEGLLLGETWS